MIFGNHQLLFVGIRAQLNDLHTVQQRSGNRIQRVGGGDKHYIGKVIGNFQIVVTIGMILLGIQNLQQRSTGVTPVVGTHLVDFVQKQHGIAAACLSHGGHNPAGHGTHIGLPVATDIRLVMDAAQRDPCHFPVQALGNGIGNRGFTHAGRADQTENLGRHGRCHLANRDGLQNPLLHLFKTEMVLLQNFPGCSHIHPFLGSDIPGKFQNRIQIIAQDSTLGRAEGLLFQPVHILQKLLLLLLRKLQCLNLLGICIEFIGVLAFAQFLTDHPHLLAQIVIPLILVDVGTGPLMNLRFHFQHFDLVTQELYRQLQPLHGIHHAKKFCFFLIVDAGILADGVGNETGIFAGEHFELNGLGRILSNLQIAGIEGIGLPAQSLGTDSITQLRIGDTDHNALQVRLLLGQVADSGPAQTGNQHPQVFPLGLQDLFDLGNGADGVKVLQFRIRVGNIPLGNQQNGLILFHGRFQSPDGLGTTNVKMNGLIREHRQASQSQNRHSPGKDRFSQGNLPPCAKNKRG